MGLKKCSVKDAVLFILLWSAFTSLYVFASPVWDFYDGFVSHLAGGVATRGVLTEFYFFSFWEIAPCLIWIQSHFPDLNTTGLFFILLYGLVAASTVYFFKIMFDGRFWHALVMAIIILMPTFFVISITGLSFLLCGICLLWLLISSNGSVGYPIIILAWFFYAIGFLIRQESGMGASLIVGIGVLIFSYQRKNAIIRLLPFAATGCAIAFFSFNQLKEDAPFLFEAERALFYVGDGSKGNYFREYENAQDSMKTVAVERFFINDEVFLTAGFINALAYEKASDTSFSNFLLRLKNATGTVANILLETPYFIFLHVIMISLIIYLRKSDLRFWTFQFFFWITLLLVAYSVKMENRHFLYMNMLYAMINALPIAGAYAEGAFRNRSFNLAVAILFSTLLLYGGVAYAFARSQEADKIEILNLVEVEVNEMAKGKILLLDGDSKDIFSAYPLELRRFDSAAHILYYDMGEMAILPEYNEYLDQFCACNSRNPAEFYSVLQLMDKDSLLVISNETRSNFITSYLEILHGKKITFQPVEGDFFLHRFQQATGQLRYYKMM